MKEEGGGGREGGERKEEGKKERQQKEEKGGEKMRTKRRRKERTINGGLTKTKAYPASEGGKRACNSRSLHCKCQIQCGCQIY